MTLGPAAADCPLWMDPKEASSNQPDRALFYALLMAYVESVTVLLGASEFVRPDLSDQVLLRAAEELERLTQLLDPDFLAIEQYAALSERCWQLEAELQTRFLRP